MTFQMKLFNLYYVHALLSFFLNAQYNATTLLLLLVMILWHYRIEILILEPKAFIVEVNVIILILESC